MINESLIGRNVLVTGASGFVGTALCKALTAAGAIVHGVSRQARSGDPCAHWWRSDLAELDEVRQLLIKVRPRVVFHLASHVVGGRTVGLVPSMFEANLQSSVNLLTAVTEQGTARLLLTGSLEEPQPDGEWAIPSSPYAAAKYAAGTYARMFHHLYQTPVVMMRLYMVYGPGQRDRKKLVPYTILSLLDRRAPELSGGMRRVDWIYIDDVVRAMLAAAVAPGIEGQTLDVGSGTLITVRHVVERLVSRIDPSIEPRFGAVPERAYEQERVANVADTETAIGWRPSIGLDKGLVRTIKWYREHALAICVRLFYCVSSGIFTESARFSL